MKKCVIFALILFAAVGCEKKRLDSFDAGYATKMLTLPLSADPQTLDPGRASGSPEAMVAFNLFEGLLMPGPTTEGLKDQSELVRPGVAKSYEVSEDGKTYTFHLRRDAKWSDGKSVTARDFEYSWKRILTPDFPADYVQFLWIIDKGEEYSKGTLKDWSKVGVKVADDYTISIHLKYAAPYFPELVAFYTFFPVRKDVVEKYGDNWTRPEHIVTNGSYMIKSYVPQQQFVLKRNPYYWDEKDVAIEDATLKIISDSNAIVNAYKTGQLHDAGSSLPIAQITSLLTHPDYRREPMLGTYFYRINVKKKGPLQDPRVRKALYYALDRESLVDYTLNGLNEPATAFVPKMAGWEPTAEPGFNIKKAKDLLKEAGYPGGKGFPEISLLYNTSENHKLIAEAVQDMWKRNLGIEVRLNNKEWKTFLQDVDTLSFDIARGGWIGDYNDPMTFLDMWTGENGNNDTGWNDAEYNGLIDEANREGDAEKRIGILRHAEEILMDRGPVIPIYYYSQNSLIARKLKGVEANNRGIHMIKYMTLIK